MILDHTDDEGRYLKVVFAEKGVPALIKTAADVTKSRVKHAEDYALPEKMKYPITDAGNAVASSVYFAKFGGQLSPDAHKRVGETLKLALEEFGFTPPEEITKAASVQLGYSGEAKDMALETLFNVPDKDFKVLDSAFKGTTPRGKRRMMLQLKEAGVKLASDQTDYAEQDFGTDWPIAMKSREMCLKSAASLQKLSSIDGLVGGSHVEPGDLVQVLEEFDVENNLVHLYGKYIPDPYQSVYGRTLEKSAAETALFNGETVAAPELKELITKKYDKLAESFGKEAADQLLQDPVTVYNSLPTPQKLAIQEMYN